MRRGLGAMCSSRFRIAWRLRPSGHQWRQDCEPRRADVAAGFELVRGVCSPASSASTSPSSTTERSDAVECPFETISRNRFFDNVTLYWLTATGASAARTSHGSHQSLDPDRRVTVPAALTTYPRDIEKHPRPWAKVRFRRIVRWRAATFPRWRSRGSSCATCGRGWRRCWRRRNPSRSSPSGAPSMSVVGRW